MCFYQLLFVHVPMVLFLQGSFVSDSLRFLKHVLFYQTRLLRVIPIPSESWFWFNCWDVFWTLQRVMGTWFGGWHDPHLCGFCVHSVRCTWLRTFWWTSFWEYWREEVQSVNIHSFNNCWIYFGSLWRSYTHTHILWRFYEVVNYRCSLFTFLTKYRIFRTVRRT